MKHFFRGQRLAVMSVLLGMLLAGAVSVYAGTTIGTDINTGGSLTVSGDAIFSSAGAGNFIFGTDPATFNTPPVPGTFIVGNSGYTTTASNGEARIEFSHQETNPNQFSLEEHQMSFTPTANSTEGAHGYGFATYLQGDKDFSGNSFYHPGNINAYILYSSTGSITNLTNLYLGSQTGFGNVNGPITNSTDLWIGAPSLFNVTNRYGLYMEDQSGSASNVYYTWFDSQGVRRVKEDNTFNGVGQAIEALYNPQFTKYTPGTANYERIVLGQWSSNTAQIGTEAGGTGTLRPLQLIGSAVGIGTSTPIANFQVANGTNATTTAEFGSKNQNKGSCLKLYRTDGTAIYAYVAAGATTLTLSTTACATVTNF